MKGPVHVAFDPKAGRAAIELYHPTGNIITAEMAAALISALERLAGEPHLKLITIEGAGPDFSFGASIHEHTAEEIPRVLPQMDAMILALLDAPAVTAAVVRGRCLGGGFELALACDVIFAGTSASFGLPEVGLGVFPPAAAALLPARIGTARATQSIITGASIPATDWQQAGLVSLVAADADLAVRIDRWFATHLAAKSAAALRYAALAARWSLRAHVRTVLPQLERLYLDDLMRTEDAAEGIAAFLGKRLPDWKDR